MEGNYNEDKETDISTDSEEEYIGDEFGESDESDYLDENSASDGDYGFGGSEPSPLGGLFGLFKDTLELKDSTKVSNLNPEELGHSNLSVRDCKRIALIASTFHHSGVANFFLDQAQIVTDTSMSKKGWFTELFVTSKKYASRDSSSSLLGLPQDQNKKEKWKIFSEKDQGQQLPPE